jgi:hypothetical protein
LPELDPSAPPAAAWEAFERRLGGYLHALQPGEAVVIAVADSPRYLQFLSFGDALHGEVSHDRKAEDASPALDLGWQEPPRGFLGRSKTGVDNLQADVPAHDAARLATMTVGVLRDVWGVHGPQMLLASKVNDEGGPPIERLQLRVAP